MTTAEHCQATHQTPIPRKLPTGVTPSATLAANRTPPCVPRDGAIRMLRLAQVKAVTGLGKTKIYELQGEGSFPMRVKITARSVAWIEDEVQAWLAARVETSPPLRALQRELP